MAPNPRTVVIDVALAETSVTDADVLEALCDVHVSATEQACKSYDNLLDWDEYREVAL